MRTEINPDDHNFKLNAQKKIDNFFNIMKMEEFIQNVEIRKYNFIYNKIRA